MILRTLGKHEIYCVIDTCHRLIRHAINSKTLNSEIDMLIDIQSVIRETLKLRLVCKSFRHIIDATNKFWNLIFNYKSILLKFPHSFFDDQGLLKQQESLFWSNIPNILFDFQHFQSKLKSWTVENLNGILAPMELHQKHKFPFFSVFKKRQIIGSFTVK